MGLEKVTYVDGSTVITAQNLNAIQDSIIDLEASRTVPSNVRNAIYTLLENAAYATTGLEDEIAVVEAWAEEVTSLTLSVSTLSLDSDDPQVITATTVPIGATVTWSSSNNSVATVSDGIVTGVSNGSCVITASAGELVATCDVTVAGFVELVSISAVYTQSGTVYDTDSVDSLKADLVVTATYSDSSTETIPSTDYTLSGTLTAGTSTITVVYGGKTATFNVTVTTALLYNWDFTQSATDTVQGAVFNIANNVSSLTENGLYFTSTNAGVCDSGNAKVPLGGSLTIEFGEMDYNATGGQGNGGVLNTPLLLKYRANYRIFSIYADDGWQDAWVTYDGRSDANCLSNKTFVMNIGNDGSVTMLRDGAAFGSAPAGTITEPVNVQIGNTTARQNYRYMTIKRKATDSQ